MTPSASPTATVTPTATPSLVDVTFELTIEETPIAGAPVEIDSTTYLTDDQGIITAQLHPTDYHTVKSALAAISFATQYESGATFAEQSPVTIEAERLIKATEQPCRIFIDQKPHFYFSTNNLSDTTLAVPYYFRSLNSLYSATGRAIQPDLFPPGLSGFTVPQSEFLYGDLVLGMWQILGQQIVLSQRPPVCTQNGMIEQCTTYDSATQQRPFEYTKGVITRLSQRALKVVRTVRRGNSSERAIVSFISRSTSALSRIRTLLKINDPRPKLLCNSVPINCVKVAVPKSALVKTFTGVFTGTIPPALKTIVAEHKRSVHTFAKEINKLPDYYVVCE